MGLFDKDEPETATVAGEPFACQVCKNDRFWPKEAVGHNPFAHVMDFQMLICSNCGYVHWFMPDAG